VQREIITGNKKFSEIIGSLDKVAESRSIVLIQGASGTGKELLAERIHSKSRRASGPFVSVNCAGLTDVELEMELFGIERNNGQGQVSTKVGKFEQAHGGTLLIEEIGQMDLKIQSKLLRTLQEGKIDRVGGRNTLSVDVRVLVGSSQDLRDFVKSGKFREDLFFRLNVIKVEIPRLVDREEDIKLLSNHFISKISESLGMVNAEEQPNLQMKLC
jgi:DNA-binding NtrC family response regulator